MSERNWTRKCSGAGVYEGWGDEDEMRCRQVRACVIGWVGGQTDP